MKKLKEFLIKPRGIYFSIVAVLTLTMFLMTISFSYYVPTSTTKTEMTVGEIVNTLSIDDNETNSIVLGSLEEKTITFRIKSYNLIDTMYYIYYDKNINISYEIIDGSDNTIKESDEETITVKFTNNSEEEVTVGFNIASGFVGKTLEVDGIIVK